MALEVQGNADIWLLDGERTSQLTFDPSVDAYPLWSPDGSRIVFSKLTPGHLDLYLKSSSGAGAEELFLATDQVKIPFSWSADGKFLLFLSGGPNSGADLWILPMTGDRIPFVFLKTPFDEVWGQFSPDGRWVAYHSNETGRFEVYVRPFVRPDDTGVNPKSAGGKWRVSIEGGVYPTWRPDGKELYFVNPAGGMMAAPITTTATTVEPGTAVRLFQTHMPGGGDDNNRSGRQYDVAPDGRFLINTLDADVATQITLIQNWNPDAGK
jgi:Tol biopolymer transport system component